MQSMDGNLGINYNVRLMIKNLIFSIVISLSFLLPVNSVSALEGLAKFVKNKSATVFLEIAVTPEEKAKGLMNRTHLNSNRGMVFVFKPATKVTFWMKDTLISLDMIFINKGRVVNIVKDAIPNQTNILYPSEQQITEVIEVNAGFSNKYNIKIGDTVNFENISHIQYSMNSELMILRK